MAFVPSRDLPPLHSRNGYRTTSQKTSAVLIGLRQIEAALGVEEGEYEHFWVGQWPSGKEEDSTTKTALHRHTKTENDRPIDQNSIDLDAVRKIDECAEYCDDEGQEDEFETRFVREWLVHVSCLRWLSVEVSQEDDTEAAEESEGVDEILRKAARLISICAGKSASGKQNRVYHFGDSLDDVSVRLQEQVLVHDALGARTWGSAPLLASRMLHQYFPMEWRRRARSNTGPSSFNVLELGAGTGLVSLALAQSIRIGRPPPPNGTSGRVVLTDFHHDVLVNLQHNVNLNGWGSATKARSDEQTSSVAVQVEVASLDWRESQASLGEQTFDIIVAADCIYEEGHAQLIRMMAERYLSQTQREDEQTFVLPSKLFLTSALRPTHQVEIEQIHQEFPLADTFTSKSSRSSTSQMQLCITNQQDLSGHDDFGPPKLRLGTAAANRTAIKTQQSPFREYTIQWCRI